MVELLDLYRHDGEGRFVSEVIPHLLTYTNVANSLLPPTSTDVDGDGDVNVFVGTSATGGSCGATNLILRNDGTGAFTVHADVEVVCSNFGGLMFCSAQNCTLLRNDGTGSFTAVVLAGAQQRFGAQALDVQGDGFVDLVFVGSPYASSPLLVMLNDGSGVFGAAPLLPYSVDGLRSGS